MPIHQSAFEPVDASLEQLAQMETARYYTKNYAFYIEAMLPDGADKTYIMRRIRETAMWINTALLREADGTPRVNGN